MFFFGKKQKSIPVKDVVYLSITAKWNACCAVAAAHPSMVFIAWFQHTQQVLTAQLQAKGITGVRVLLYREVIAHSIAGRHMIVAEHYPLQQKETDLFTSLGLAEVTIFSALDEPLFSLFGSENIIRLMQTMGMKDDEPVSHSYITAAIHRAQEKIAAQVTLEQSAVSQEEWFRRNVASGK